MLLEVLGHAEGLDPLPAEDRLHHRVGREPLLVLWVLDTQVHELSLQLATILTSFQSDKMKVGESSPVGSSP